MKIDVRDDTSVGSVGYAILCLGERLEGDLVFAIQFLDGTYLGLAGSRTRRLHLFTAPKILDAAAGSQFRIGPEITQFIEAEEKLAFKSPTNALVGEVFWADVTPPSVGSQEAGGLGRIPNIEKERRRRLAEERAGTEQEGSKREQEEARRRKGAEEKRAQPPQVAAAAAPAQAANDNKSFWTGRKIAAIAVSLFLGLGGFLVSNRDLVCQTLDLGCGDERAWAEAQDCATAAAICQRDVCYTRYIDWFPRGTFIQQARVAGDAAKNECRRVEAEEREEQGGYQRALTCMQQNVCDAEQRRREAERRREEELVRREQDMFNQAIACSTSRSACTAGSCFASYLQEHPNGRFRAEAQRRAAGTRSQCVLPNGVYAATRSYTNPNRPAQDGECPGSDQFDVKIEDGTIEFRTDGNRLFRGRVNQETGVIRIETDDITPATKTPFSISGRYDNGQMQNGFCLEGNFKIDK